jgi:AhpD family alkylhydroperoxidase
MSYLPPRAVLLDVFRARPEACPPLIDYHQVLLRGPSPLSVAERELIAAYVSGLNACGHCHGVQAATAHAFGIPETTLAALLADVGSAPGQQSGVAGHAPADQHPAGRGDLQVLARTGTPLVSTSEHCQRPA